MPFLPLWSRSRVDIENDWFSTKILLENYSNFKSTGPPTRFMYYHAGSWLDFPTEVVDQLRAGFKQGEPVIEVQTEGIRFLFDLYRMIQVDMESGENRSISWTDIKGESFFPRTFVDKFRQFDKSDVSPNVEVLEITKDSSSRNSKIGFQIQIGGTPTSNLNSIPNSDLNPSSSKRKREVLELGNRAKRGFGPLGLGLPRWPNTKLLVEGEPLYKIVKEHFMSGVGINEQNVKIIAIHQCLLIDRMDKARSSIFSSEVDKTKPDRRGPEAKVTFGWHGTSVENVKSIMNFGFVRPSRIFGSQAHGIGVHLSPLCAPHVSALLSEVDDYGEHHVLLCRVESGRREETEAGSEQLLPCTGNFDTGVDDLGNPKWREKWLKKFQEAVKSDCG
ncbi:hypothetical protein Vadar_014199 [Vaccinium darrowii]|uniref:Uncharacterized protein n=1 Tax=Vaccinium darrowii TaxID=229202 RepID=A0ACB7XZT2_9ERIC|nr:hypothetical protein Vadar_014199 [Vaccinium darrowii]